MKMKWNGETPQGLQELTSAEARAIVGGESLWFWIGYGLGRLGNAIANA